MMLSLNTQGFAILWMAMGKPIGSLDTMIAASCLSHQFTIVTHNVFEFSRVPGLTVENWQ
ncbi:tRNA(fMet)-specific endonuclease VapC [Rubripirellula reticaptiva]|uniref:tRNA(fMet)-specific endonuclease VapC n=1 Tax=Rubripirellula reticaptiva TaxID=2528013 RepID=A0A5C6EHB9_9BACT|nr:tRNA(fMet)-specific endonuclease VapC [Rubripirellula reticaptiva]